MLCLDGSVHENRGHVAESWTGAVCDYRLLLLPLVRMERITALSFRIPSGPLTPASEFQRTGQCTFFLHLQLFCSSAKALKKTSSCRKFGGSFSRGTCFWFCFGLASSCSITGAPPASQSPGNQSVGYWRMIKKEKNIYGWIRCWWCGGSATAEVLPNLHSESDWKV